ncbi:hypothetical protein [Vibrio sonorensis]|uniref:hypothetical protein n=1 Tax=Vibrio sonorensis TaxID=1004316 RepID=UPI0008D9A539|nr:hypothetical protein [Vibrio sonorensis]
MNDYMYYANLAREAEIRHDWLSAAEYCKKQSYTPINWKTVNGLKPDLNFVVLELASFTTTTISPASNPTNTVCMHSDF